MKEKYLENAEITEEMRRIHKKPLTNLEVNAPVALESQFKKHVVYSTKTGFSICKHLNKSGIEKVYLELKDNFEREVCDLVPGANDGECDAIYLLVFPLLNPGYKLSNRFRYIGIMEVHDDIIQYAWVHPYLRNRGIMKNFLHWYGSFENMLAAQPPISKSFEYCMKASDKLFKELPKSEQMHTQHIRKWLKKKSPVSKDLIDLLDDGEVKKVRFGCEVLCAEKCKEQDFREFQSILEKNIESMVKTLIYMKENPDRASEIKDWALKNYNPEDLSELLMDFRKYGITSPECK